MRKLLTFALAGISAAALAGAPVAGQPTKTMKLPLADGSTVTVEYVGDVPPKVTVIPGARASRLSHHWMFPEFADFDWMIADLNRRTAEMMRRMEEMRRQGIAGGVPGVNLAAAGNMPEGATSVSVVTVSNGGKSCMRTTKLVSQGAGKPPKVTRNVSGDCGPQPAATVPPPPTT